MSDEYSIRYMDPETGEEKIHDGDYESLMWAEDHAYALADKGPYRIYKLIKVPASVSGSFYKEVSDGSES